MSRLPPAIEDQLRASQNAVRAATAARDDAIAARNALVRSAIECGMSRYRIAQVVGLTQQAVSLMARPESPLIRRVRAAEDRD